MKFVCSTLPYLRILLADGDYAQFQGGSLELDPGDPGFDEVMAEAQQNPAIAIIQTESTCVLCGEAFTGKNAKTDLSEHVKTIHPDVYDAEQALAQALSREKQLKDRAGYACDVCQPVQTFGTESDLAQHVTELHTQPPAMDAEGNETGGGERRPGEVAVPAARASRKHSG